MSHYRCCLAELLGTCALVFAGTAAMVVDAQQGGLGTVGIALVFGLVAMALIYALGEVSGAHLNPAVTLAFALGRRFPWRQVPAYVAAQTSGAVLASLLVRLLIGTGGNLGGTWVKPAVQGMLPPLLAAGLLELVFSWLLMLVILGVSTGAKEKGLMAGLAIGGTVALLACVGGPLTGASMNPARSLGPALVGGRFAELPIYLLAPCLGSALALATLCMIRPRECCPVGEATSSCC